MSGNPLNKQFFSGVGFFLLSFGIYGYESHIEEVPITKRRRFVALTKGQMEQISTREFEEQLKENQADILPTNNTSYRRIARVAQRIIAANKDLGEISKKEWTITVIDDPQKNAFVLPVSRIPMIEVSRNIFNSILSFISDWKHFCIYGHARYVRQR